MNLYFLSLLAWIGFGLIQLEQKKLEAYLIGSAAACALTLIWSHT